MPLAGPCHLTDGTKPLRPGFSVLKNGKNFGGRRIQFHHVLETHGRGVKERGIHGTTRKAHGSASQVMCGETAGGEFSTLRCCQRLVEYCSDRYAISAIERRLRSCRAGTPFGALPAVSVPNSHSHFAGFASVFEVLSPRSLLPLPGQISAGSKEFLRVS
jgi:hypothetical protein